MGRISDVPSFFSADQAVIELHARFLEVNFLSQIRALPNPSASPQSSQPLTLHLSPTSTANIIVTSLNPPQPSAVAFTKISPDAEVIVAPKTRQRASRSSGRESRSVASAGRKSAGGKSGTSTVRHASSRADAQARDPVFFRGIDRGIGLDWFDDQEEDMKNEGLKVWVDPGAMLSKALRGVSWVVVSVISPAGLQGPHDMQHNRQTTKELEPNSRIVARLSAWEDAPDGRHAALSSPLCACLNSQGLLGGPVRVEAAPAQIHKLPATSSADEKDHLPRKLKVFPFSSTITQGAGFHFGGESNGEKEEATRRLSAFFVGTVDSKALLKGPITDGMVLPPIISEGSECVWPGGLLRFDPLPVTGRDGRKASLNWYLGSEKKFGLELQLAIPKPSSLAPDSSSGEALPEQPPSLVGNERIAEDVTTNLTHFSSVMLTGGLGSGKTSLTQVLCHRLRNEFLYHTTYFPCRRLTTDESRISTIKETINRIFARAAWGARMGGRSLVVLDDLDRLCPTETELQVGGNNERSRQISEIICTVVHQYCSSDSPVVLLATAQSKEAVNNVVIGSHVVREIISLMAPNKQTRREVLEALVHKSNNTKQSEPLTDDILSDTKQVTDTGAWMEESSTSSRPNSAREDDRFVVSPEIDFSDVAGQTDGYMPGDLSLLVSRARSEALIRSIAQTAHGNVELSSEDFTAALRGFTPASLRNVSLQTSSTSFSSIGGLKYTRQILLETLQYPTTYAPIFANCPLRLRSGLLLYGYPGCGKTLLASAVAGECGLNFISVKGPEILNKYIGASEKSVRDLFERAQAARPCVLFFDEFDSVAPKRGHDSTGVTDRVVNQLLTQMDGAEGLTGVYVLAATSRPDLIDPALLRPGRLDKSLICDLPNLEDRVDILRTVCKKLKVDDSILGTGDEGHNLLEAAKRTDGYTGADLQAVVYNAHLEAIHDVLDVDATGQADYASGPRSKDHMSRNATRAPSKTPEFIHFRFGDHSSVDSDGPGPASGKDLTERAKIADQLANLQLQRRRQKELTRASHHFSHLTVAYDNERNQGEVQDQDSEKEPVISWHHLESSLQTTRSSISPEEQMRLARIYREFLVGRNGNMPSGQGGNEIGGRTSLM